MMVGLTIWMASMNLPVEAYPFYLNFSRSTLIGIMSVSGLESDKQGGIRVGRVRQLNVLSHTIVDAWAIGCTVPGLGLEKSKLGTQSRLKPKGLNRRILELLNSGESREYSYGTSESMYFC